jgi:hypothetical protein
MKSKYNKKLDYIENPIDGRPLLGPTMPISGIIAVMLVFYIYRSCKDNKYEYKILDNKKVFNYVYKTTNDTVKFYGYNNLDSAIIYAKKEKKNILLIFSGYACMSEPGREWKILSLFGNNDKLQDSFIITWLAVDDKTTEKDTNQIVFLYGKEQKIIKQGDQNKYFQEIIFKKSTQPLFCFIDTLKKPFGKTLGFTNSKKEVEDFVYSGIRGN